MEGPQRPARLAVRRPDRPGPAALGERPAGAGSGRRGLLGGGEDWWLPGGSPGAFQDKPAEDPSEASKGTKDDLIKKARKAGYTYVSGADQLDRAKGGKLLGLFANEEMFQQPPEGQGDAYHPVVGLSTMTGVDVPVTAAGPLANRFTGKHANTYVHDVLSEIPASAVRLRGCDGRPAGKPWWQGVPGGGKDPP